MLPRYLIALNKLGTWRNDRDVILRTSWFNSITAAQSRGASTKEKWKTLRCLGRADVIESLVNKKDRPSGRRRLEFQSLGFLRALDPRLPIFFARLAHPFSSLPFPSFLYLFTSPCLPSPFLILCFFLVFLTRCNFPAFKKWWKTISQIFSRNLRLFLAR